MHPACHPMHPASHPMHPACDPMHPACHPKHPGAHRARGVAPARGLCVQARRAPLEHASPQQPPPPPHRVAGPPPRRVAASASATWGCRPSAAQGCSLRLRHLGLQLAPRAHGCRRGEQLFVSYGERDNLRWLLHYGFALADNPEQRVAFDVIDLVRVAIAAVVSIATVSRSWP